jgi:hypothetical protein
MQTPENGHWQPGVTIADSPRQLDVDDHVL